MNETYYKPLTPELRDRIIDSVENSIKDLKTCELDAFVRMQIYGHQAFKHLIRSLPDGYLIPIKK